jgi:hypothetical protein
MDAETGNLNTLVINQDSRANPNITCGNFALESEAQAWLIDFLGRCQDKNGDPFFRRVMEFRTGVPLFRHHRQSIEKDGYRCDVIALPNRLEYSDLFGAMVFEVKKSDLPVGPGLSQLKDYMASVFDVGGIQVVPSFGFLFPCLKQHSATASWMAHQSMGSVFQAEYDQHVRFFSGEERLLEFDANGRLIFSRTPRSGRGSGRR